MAGRDKKTGLRFCPWSRRLILTDNAGTCVVSRGVTDASRLRRDLPAKDTDEDEVAEQNVGQTRKAAKKKALPDEERKTIPEGTRNALQGLTILFTLVAVAFGLQTCKLMMTCSGTFEIDRKTSEATANAAWTSISKRFGYVAALGKSVQPVASGGRTLYRLRVNAGSANQAADICGRLKVAGEACFIAS